MTSRGYLRFLAASRPPAAWPRPGVVRVSHRRRAIARHRARYALEPPRVLLSGQVRGVAGAGHQHRDTAVLAPVVDANHVRRCSTGAARPSPQSRDAANVWHPPRLQTERPPPARRAPAAKESSSEAAAWRPRTRTMPSGGSSLRASSRGELAATRPWIRCRPIGNTKRGISQSAAPYRVVFRRRRFSPHARRGSREPLDTTLR